MISLTILGIAAGITLVLTIVGYSSYFAYIKSQFKYDVHVRQEQHSGVTVLKKDIAKMYADENGVRKMFIRGYKATWQIPTTDSIETQSGGRPLINLWRDINGEFHLCRFTKTVPVVIENEDGHLEIPTYDVKTPTGEVIKMGFEERIFSPDNKTNRFWAVNEMRGLWHRHKERDWWTKYGGTVTIGIVATVGIVALIFTGYFIAKMVQQNVGACTAAVESSKSYLQSLTSLVVGK